jgi:catechol 2,3-dioxygenase-like lactoylglutathione lyase family enzyme
MLDHVSLGVTNLERSRHFYDETLRPLGIVRTVDFDRGGRLRRDGGIPRSGVHDYSRTKRYSVTRDAPVLPSA